jgi:hypothetical protein
VPIFRTIGKPLLGEKKPFRKKKKRERENAIMRSHYVLPATPKGSARTSIRPKYSFL